METLHLKVIRKHLRDKYTIGHFYIDGVYVFDTIEDTVRPLVDINKDGDFDDVGEGKIFGKTAIPEGTYRVIVNYSPKFKRYLPLLIGVKGFQAIRIHTGNDETHTEGCIIVGKNKEVGKVLESKQCMNALMAIIENQCTFIKDCRPVIIQDEGYGSMYKFHKQVLITISNG